MNEKIRALADKVTLYVNGHLTYEDLLVKYLPMREPVSIWYLVFGLLIIVIIVLFVILFIRTITQKSYGSRWYSLSTI